MTQYIRVTQSNHIATVTLNRPDKRNALHGPLAAELLSTLKKLATDTTRILVLTGEGENFCAGGDVAWMQKIATESAEKNQADAQLLADTLYALYYFPKPTVVLAQGAILGGGLGLLAAADIAIAARNAVFGLPEVKIGMTPAVISPYILTAMGERAANYYFLTGERFHAEQAQQLGLVHQVVDDDILLSTGMQLATTLLQNGTQGMQAAKQIIRLVARKPITSELTKQTAEQLATLRTTPEAQEGLQAFLEKRKPKWAV